MVRHIRHYRLGKEKIHMIYDKRAELARYFGLSPNLDAAIRFLQTTDLTALPMGLSLIHIWSGVEPRIGSNLCPLPL